MIFMHDLHRDTLKKADQAINAGRDYMQVLNYFFDMGYQLRAPQGANGRPLKARTMLYKGGVYSFVDIRKTRNGGAIWETVKIS